MDIGFRSGFGNGLPDLGLQIPLAHNGRLEPGIPVMDQIQDLHQPQGVFGLRHPAQEENVVGGLVFRRLRLLPEGIHADHVPQDRGLVLHRPVEPEALHGRGRHPEDVPEFPADQQVSQGLGRNLPGVEAVIVDMGNQGRSAAGQRRSEGGLHIVGMDNVRLFLGHHPPDFLRRYGSNGPVGDTPGFQGLTDGPIRGHIHHVVLSPEHIHDLADHILRPAEKHIAEDVQDLFCHGFPLPFWDIIA